MSGCAACSMATPPVHLGERGVGQGRLTLNPQTVRPQDDEVLARCLISAFRSLA